MLAIFIGVIMVMIGSVGSEQRERRASSPPLNAEVVIVLISAVAIPFFLNVCLMSTLHFASLLVDCKNSSGEGEFLTCIQANTHPLHLVGMAVTYTLGMIYLQHQVP